MTDLEITKLCAEAMGVNPTTAERCPICSGTHGAMLYDPLHDDAQAMALMKKFRLWIDLDAVDAHKGDLNRVICEYVAQMQKSRVKEAA